MNVKVFSVKDSISATTGDAAHAHINTGLLVMMTFSFSVYKLMPDMFI